MTGRSVGGPATDLLLRKAAAGTLGTTVGYETRLPDGRSLRSTTVIVRDEQGAAIAALCINSDVMIWQAVKAIAESMLPSDAPAMKETQKPPEDEKFFQDIDELAQHLLAEAIEAAGAPVDLMQKRHKIAVVKDLKDRGFFMLKESVEMAAQALQVTRFTIYNYLQRVGERRARRVTRPSDPELTQSCSAPGALSANPGRRSIGAERSPKHVVTVAVVPNRQAGDEPTLPATCGPWRRR